MAYTGLLVPALTIIRQIHAVAIPAFPSLNTSSSVESLSTSSSCDSIHGCRTMWDIVYGCLATIFACTYTSFHPDVPDQTRIHINRTLAAIIGFFVPEYAVAMAASQCLEVRNHHKKIPFRGWGRKHSYFTVMGGFRGWGSSLSDISSLNAASYPEMFKRDAATDNMSKEDAPSPSSTPSVPPTGEQATYSPSEFRIRVTEKEIEDKSKVDGLGKIFTMFQTTWFIVQYLERWVAHQPRTQLEAMTLAYAILNIIIFFLWKHKPLDVQEPIDVSGRASGHIEEHASDHIEEGGLLWWRVFRRTLRAMGIAPSLAIVTTPVIGFIFGGIHCFAWWFPFPTHREQVLWRFSSLVCTVSPVLLTIPVAIGGAPHDTWPRWINVVLKWLNSGSRLAPRLLSVVRSARWSAFWEPGSPRGCSVILSLVIREIFMCLAAFSASGYVICRGVLIVLTFTSLRALPAGAFEAASWTSFFPHFG